MLIDFVWDADLGFWATKLPYNETLGFALRLPLLKLQFFRLQKGKRLLEELGLKKLTAGIGKINLSKFTLFGNWQQHMCIAVHSNSLKLRKTHVLDSHQGQVQVIGSMAMCSPWEENLIPKALEFKFCLLDEEKALFCVNCQIKPFKVP